MLQLPTGIDNFGKVIEKNLTFIDKTLLIKDIIDDSNTEVAVITRPRRFGKSLNLSMLHYFFTAEAYGRKTAGLFDGLKISKVDNGAYMQHQGKYPVIFITLKVIKDGSFASVLKKFRFLIEQLYSEHRYLEHSDQLTLEEKGNFLQVVRGETDQEKLENAIFYLSSLLYKHHRRKVWLLIDEYDTPIQEAYLHNYYNEMVAFLRNMFGIALKSNPYLEKGVLTGILRVSKESIFSDLNNLRVYSVLQNRYNQYFGFLEEEVLSLLTKANLQDQIDSVRHWYNGYQFGNTTVYNPWSIISYINEEGVFRPYWLNTSENTLIKNLFLQFITQFKEQFEALLQNQPTEQLVDEKLVFGYLRSDPASFWTLLVMAGYLKAIASHVDEKGKIYCQLMIPNLEVKSLYQDMVEQWLTPLESGSLTWHKEFLDYLLSGNVVKFTENLQHILQYNVSFHDTAKNPEIFYHGLFLGFLASINQNTYEIKSNRESGFGRYDIVIIPKDLAELAIIIELKKIDSSEETKLLAGAEAALKQIDTKDYLSEFRQRGLNNVLKIGLAFCGKEFKLLNEKTQLKNITH